MMIPVYVELEMKENFGAKMGSTVLAGRSR